MCWVISKYGDYKIAQIETQSKIEIAKLKSESDKHYVNVMENITNALKEVK